MNQIVNSSKNKGAILLGTFIFGIALIICTVIMSSTFIKVKGMGNKITVTGAAYKPIISDFASWKGYFEVTSLNLASAYTKLEQNLAKVKTFMTAQGFGEGSYKISGVDINRQYDRDGVPKDYVLRQHIELELDDVARISRIAQESSILIREGVEFSSYNPSYIYSKLDDVKLEMIKAATENAKLRAEQLARTTGKKVGAPTSARVGVFQIRPRHSQEVSSYGISDVSSIDKEIACTVHISFLIE